MNTHNICFCGEIKKNCLTDNPSYLKLCFLIRTDLTVGKMKNSYLLPAAR